MSYFLIDDIGNAHYSLKDAIRFYENLKKKPKKLLLVSKEDKKIIKSFVFKKLQADRVFSRLVLNEKGKKLFNKYNSNESSFDKFMNLSRLSENTSIIFNDNPKFFYECDEEFFYFDPVEHFKVRYGHES